MGSYQAIICAVAMGQERNYASYVMIGCDSHLRRHAPLDAYKWNPEEYPRSRLPLDVIAKQISTRCRELNVIGVAYDPARASALAQALMTEGVPVYASPMNAANKKRVATVLMSVFANHRVDLYDDKQLATEIVKLPLKTSVEGYALDPAADNSGKLDLCLAFAVALIWAEGTMAEEM